MSWTKGCWIWNRDKAWPVGRKDRKLYNQGALKTIVLGQISMPAHFCLCCMLASLSAERFINNCFVSTCLLNLLLPCFPVKAFQKLLFKQCHSWIDRHMGPLTEWELVWQAASASTSIALLDKIIWKMQTSRSLSPSECKKCCHWDKNTRLFRGTRGEWGPKGR